MPTRTEVNHFESRSVNGKPMWFWEDEPGSQCGRTRKWKYEVQRGDSFVEAGTCPQGYTFWTIEYFGTPERLA